MREDINQIREWETMKDKERETDRREERRDKIFSIKYDSNGMLFLH